MFASGLSPAEILLSAAAAAPVNVSNIPGAAGASSDLSDVKTWRTGDRQAMVKQQLDGREKPYYLQMQYAPFKGARKAQYKTATSTSCGYEPAAFATRAAAELARADFKEYVDSGMNAIRRSGGAAGHSKMLSQNTAEPTRFSPRYALPWSRVPRALLNLTVGATGVSAGLTAGTAIDYSNTTERWRGRSVNYRGLERKSRQATVDAARARVPSGDWEYFIDKCRRAQATFHLHETPPNATVR